jgi:UDP-N-acetylglucosamine 2-epimerase
LAACKLRIPLAHVEAGLRSFNREMPEEHNRVLTDHCSDLLFCPTQTAVDNLAREGITQGVHLVGDTMYDAVLQFAETARQCSTILQDLGLKPKGYLLATVHRPYNTDDPDRLRGILETFAEIGEMVIFPVHPRTRQRMAEFGLGNLQSEIRNLKFIEPVGYLDMLMLEQNARLILTDSGGMQKEAYFFGVPCVTLREETEWVETVEAGWNVLVGSNPARIVVAVRELAPLGEPAVIFGDGRASEKMAEILSQSLFLARDTFCARAFRVVRDQPARAAEDSVKRG